MPEAPTPEGAALEALCSNPAWSEPSEAWYVEPGSGLQDDILAELSGGRKHGVTWVTGPAGGGLSSELARLAERVDEHGWLAVRASMLARGEPGRELSPSPGLLILAFWLLRAFPDESASARLEHLLEQRVIRMTERLRELCMIPAPRGKVEWVNGLGRSLFMAIGRMRDPDFRAELEADLVLRPAECADLVGGLIGVLERERGKRVVVFLDDANEVDQGQAADRLITRCISMWQTLPARIVMTYPRRLDYTPDFVFGVARDPRFELETRGENAGRAFLRSMLMRRVGSLELSDALVDDVYAATLGNPGEAVRLLTDALRLCVARGQSLAAEHLAEARGRRGASLRRLVGGPAQQRGLLEIERSGQVEADSAGWFGVRVLLEAGAAGRVHVHPALLDLIPVE